VLRGIFLDGYFRGYDWEAIITNHIHWDEVGMEKNVENFATKKIISAELPTIQQNILQI